MYSITIATTFDQVFLFKWDLWSLRLLVPTLRWGPVHMTQMVLFSLMVSHLSCFSFDVLKRWCTFVLSAASMSTGSIQRTQVGESSNCSACEINPHIHLQMFTTVGLPQAKYVSWTKYSVKYSPGSCDQCGISPQQPGWDEACVWLSLTSGPPWKGKCVWRDYERA